MPDPIAKRRINVRAIIMKDGRLLAVKHRTDERGAAPYYAVPGGGLDPHESLEAGLKRELLEELGVEAQVGRLLFIQQFPSGRAGYDEELEFFFEVTNVDDFAAIDITSTSHGYELDVCEFVDPTSVVLYPVFLQSVDIAAHLAGAPTLVVDNLAERIASQA